MGRLVAIALLGAALAGSGWYWYRAKSVPVVAAVTASGTLNAVTVVQVPATISGEIKEIGADFKTAVKKGQVLARIDPATFEQRVTQARADLAAAKGAAVAQRRSLLRQAELDLERTTIRAPVDGTVILRNVDPGQTVSTGPRAPALFVIAPDLREMQLEAVIGQADAGRLRLGLPATFSVEAFPRRSFGGEVVQLRKAAGNTLVVIAAANADLALLPGMTANVRIIVDVPANPFE